MNNIISLIHDFKESSYRTHPEDHALHTIGRRPYMKNLLSQITEKSQSLTSPISENDSSTISQFCLNLIGAISSYAILDDQEYATDVLRDMRHAIEKTAPLIIADTSAPLGIGSHEKLIRNRFPGDYYEQTPTEFFLAIFDEEIEHTTANRAPNSTPHTEPQPPR